MSTRANVIIKDDQCTLYFYRHSDGYPECCGLDLKEFVKGYSEHLRSNACQSAGHLILRGHAEYKKEDLLGDGMGWKVGAYEPTDSIHGDVEYIYVIDLDKGVLETRVPSKNDFWDKPSISKTKLVSKFKFKKGDL